MGTISSPGIGSGLDVQSIVSQLVALERAPIKQLQTQATSLQTRLSTFGTIKSQMSALESAASKLAIPSSWNVVTASSSGNTAVSATANAGAATGSYSIEVQQLARAQSTVSTPVATGTSMGSGSLSIAIGRWVGGSFTSPADPVTIEVLPGEDSLSAIAAKINSTGAGVTASVLRDASGERLLLQSRETGESAGFSISATNNDGSAEGEGLSRLAFDETSTGGSSLAQSARNAEATINGVAITSASNRLSDTLPGLSLQLSQVTTQPVEVIVTTDREGLRKDIEAFVSAYNAINTTLTSALRGGEGAGKGGALQGDSTAVGLQNALRGMMRSVSASEPFSRLVDVGIELKTGGRLDIDSKRLNSALDNPQGLRGLFTVNTGTPTTEGFGLKVRSFARGLLDIDGLITSRSDAIQSAIRRNSDQQERLNDRVGNIEKRLLAQYTALDTKLAGLGGLSAYVSQQVTLWNRNG